MITRLFFFIIFLIGIDLYSFQWIRHLCHALSNPYKWGIYGLFWLGTVITIFLLVLQASGENERIPYYVLIYLRAFAFISYITKFVSLPIILFDDIRRGFGYLLNSVKPEYTYNPSRTKFMSSLAAAMATVPFTTLIYGMVRNAYRYKVHRIKVPIANLPEGLEGLKIVQISDIHAGSFTAKAPIRKSIELINELNPDLLLFTGDLVNSQADEVLPYIDIFSQLKGKIASYSIFGNHDYGDYHQWPNDEAKKANLEKLKKHHQAIGWKLLLNEHEELTIKGHKLTIIGVENFSASRRFSKYGNLSMAYQGCNPDSTKILLSHDPSHWDFEVTERYQDIALTCSGHTHGFQFGIEIPGYIKWSPSKYVYKEWAGHYIQGSQSLYVNRGFGFLAYPGRVGILPEITFMELTRA